MKVVLKPGETVEVRFEDKNGDYEDGTIKVSYTSTLVQVHADMDDSTGRGGLIYEADGEADQAQAYGDREDAPVPNLGPENSTRGCDKSQHLRGCILSKGHTGFCVPERPRR